MSILIAIDNMTEKDSLPAQPSGASEVELELEITDLSRGGAGVARDSSGRVVFVPLTAPGDLARVRIVSGKNFRAAGSRRVREKKQYAQGELIEIVRPSPARQKARCPAFGRCGGCQWQHLSYDLQWRTKVNGVQHALKRVKVDLPFRSAEAWQEFPAERSWEYRNRIQLRGFGDKIGFYAPRSHELVELDRCDIARPEINEAWEEIRNQGKRLPEPYKVEVYVTTEGRVVRVWNAPHGAAGFRQVHDEQNEKLRAWVGQALTPGRPLFDLFGGSGNLCVPIAHRMGEVHCVDISAPGERGTGVPDNIHFYRSAVVPWLLSRTKRNVKPAAGDLPESAISTFAGPASAILDPPREGLAEQITPIEKALRALRVTEVVAVGCDPDAWARDLSRWIRRGWRFERAAVLDLFPQTPHVEAMALLKID